MDGKQLAKLAKDHWEYVEELLIAHGEKNEDIELIGFHYRTAFIHGFKHGVEETKGAEHGN